MESIEKRRKASNKIIDDIRKIGDSVEKQSTKLQNKAIDTIVDKNDSLTPFVLNSLVAQQINNSVRRIVVNVEDSFEDIIKKTQKYLAQGYKIELSTANLKAISQAKSTLIDKLINNTNILKSDIKAILYSNLGKGLSQRQLVRELKELYPTYSRNAYTIVNTGTSRIYQDINASKFKQSGLKFFAYIGPKDSVTRHKPCLAWVGKAFTEKELDTVFGVRQTLFNCRHSIVGITEEDYDSMEKLIISEGL